MSWPDMLQCIRGQADTSSPVPQFVARWGTRPPHMENITANLSVKIKIRGLRQLGQEEKKVVDDGDDTFSTHQKTHKRLRVEYKFEAQKDLDSFTVWEHANRLWGKLSTPPARAEQRAVGLHIVSKNPITDYEIAAGGRVLVCAVFEVLYGFRDVEISDTEIIYSAQITNTFDGVEQPPVDLPG